MVCHKDPDQDVLAPSEAWSDDPWGAHVSDTQYLLDNYHWEAHYLNTGFTFIMRPHTVHMVLTVEPTLCHGGHFYADATMLRTFHGRRLEQFHGETLTNTSLPSSWLILHRMLLFAHAKVVTEGSKSPYSPQSLAALIVMCKYPDAFTSQTEFQPKGYRYKAQKRLAQKAADVLAQLEGVKDLVQDLVKRLLEWKCLLQDKYTDWHGHAIPPSKSWKRLISGVDREDELRHESDESDGDEGGEGEEESEEEEEQEEEEEVEEEEESEEEESEDEGEDESDY